MPKKPSANPPGRPRAFSEKDALDAAMRVFAAKGYEATSLSDLERAMGINRVSMYATFGNKEALFVKAMTRYTEVGRQRFLRFLSMERARAGFEALLRDSVAMFTKPQELGVCFVTQAPLAGGAISDETKRFVAERRADIELMLGQRLRQAVAEGELAPNTSVQDLARFFAMTLLGLALQAQHGASRSALMRVIDVAMRAWPQ